VKNDEKRDLIGWMLQQSNSVFVHLKPGHKGVQVPLQFQNDRKLCLQLGLNLARPIHDLHVTDDGFSCTLSFGGRPSPCSVPWESVFAMVTEDGMGKIWKDDAPEDAPAKKAASKRPSHLRLVK
jgi:stringent starvation protein B